VAEPESEAKRLRELDLDALAERAISLYDPGSPGRQAELELQRRLIAESARASRRLLFATCVIAVLTGVLIVLAVLELAGALD
jgi:hypothetical protein